MDGQKSRKHWLNPLFRSETESTIICSSKSAPLPSTESNYRSKRDMNRVMNFISQSWKTIKSMPSTSSFGLGDDKEVVMEGYLPTTKQSLLDFLKGMGLKPKVELVGQETIVTADASQIRDEDLKYRFIKFMKKQVVDTPHTAPSEASSTSIATPASSKASSAPSGISKASSEPSKDSSKTSQSSDPVAHSNKGKIWIPPKQLEEVGKSKKGKNTDKKKKTDPFGGAGKHDHQEFPSKSKEDAKCTKEDEKKKEKSVGFKTIGMVPVVKHVDDPFERQIPIGTHIANSNENEQLNEPENVYYPNTYGRAVWYEMNNACSLTRPQSVQDQPSYHEQQLMPTQCEPPTNWKKKKKKKKLRIMKHLRKWFSKNKDAGQEIALEISKEGEHLRAGRPRSAALSRETYDFYPMCQFQTVSVAPEPDRVAVIPQLHSENKLLRQRIGKSDPDEQPVITKLYVDCHQQNPERNNELAKKRPKKIKINPQAFDGSISMPVLITPDQSCFKTKQNSSNLLEVSKSSTVAAENYQAQDSYSVVGDSAAIHIGKKRIRLEGKDIKYGSILQKDEKFDEHFRVLKENSLSDIETQVRKAKERIMFARAMGAVGDRLPEGAPKVDYRELLVPKKIDQEKRTFDRRSHVDVAATSSFYQKFLASMNILKTTHRFNACDRSVMTDEPLSKTYAEFIKMMNNSPREGMQTGDSSVDLPATSYLKMICTCWEPLFKLFPDSHEPGRNRRPPENASTEEEKILKCIVDKVLDCSRNKKGYIKTEIKSS